MLVINSAVTLTYKKLFIDQYLSCPGNDSVGRVNSSMDTLLVKPWIWQVDDKLDAI